MNEFKGEGGGAIGELPLSYLRNRLVTWWRSRDLIWGAFSTVNTDTGFTSFVAETQWLMLCAEKELDRVRSNERKKALLYDRITTADNIEESPPKIPHSPVSKTPPRMPSRVGRFLKQFDIS